MNALGVLAPFARARRAPARAVERCQLCAADIEAEDEKHHHLVDAETRTLLCVCPTCSRLFAPHEGNRAARYRSVPDRVLVDPAAPLTEEQWATLQVPVRLAFLLFNSALGRWVALYPSPAGAAESELDDEALRKLALTHRLFASVQPDVEALLVYGQPHTGFETFLVPVDTCYRLVGRVRLHWQGFSGGDAAWADLESFFSELRGRARPIAQAEQL